MIDKDHLDAWTFPEPVWPEEWDLRRQLGELENRCQTQERRIQELETQGVHADPLRVLRREKMVALREASLKESIERTVAIRTITQAETIRQLRHDNSNLRQQLRWVKNLPKVFFSGRRAA